MFTFLKSYSFVCFNGEGKGEGEGEGKGEGEEGKKKEEKTFTQEEVNAFLAKEKRKTGDAQKKLAEQLQGYKKTAELSVDEKTELEKQIEDLQNQYMTQEERARQASDKATKVHQKEADDLAKEKDSWKDRYTHATIDIAITQAAAVNKAISAEQITAILQPKTKLSEKLDETGKPTGIFEPRVKFQDVDKDEKPITLDLTVSEAVKRMTELSQYGNLFEGGKSSGLGMSGSVNTKGGKVDIAKIAREDPARYRKLRKEQPELFSQL